MVEIALSSLHATDDVEIVERKGTGHPDTICDALAEELSRNLCREYQSRFGQILHHNVDKALLCGGSAQPAFGGGRVTAPIRLYLAGRATARVGNDIVSIKDIAIEGSRAWLKNNLHALDIDHDVEIDVLIQPGSQDLQTLFSRAQGHDLPLANDTSFGVGYAPLSALERMVLEIELRIHMRDRFRDRPAWGEDIKIMAIRRGAQVTITMACAMIGRFVTDAGTYFREKAVLAELVRECASEHDFSACDVTINTADDAASGSLYLTVTGTSAEAGDDGEVGRGNRVNGLITPGRPMSLEAAAGKNPVSHVGKIYNVLAKQMAETIVSRIPAVNHAYCLMVSQIGAPVCSPALVQIKIATKDGEAPEQFRRLIETLVADHLSNIRNLMQDMVAGKIRVY